MNQLLQTLRKIQTKLVFFTLGIGATIWFLIRVIPKPSRATYPCMRAATPFMSSFVIYLLSIGGSAFFFRKMRNKYKSARYLAAFSFFVAFVAMAMVSNSSRYQKANAMNLVPENYYMANTPVGTPQGLVPGRVVWIWNPEATDADFNPGNVKSRWWIDHTNSDVVEDMLMEGLINYTGSNSSQDAWDMLFKHFNENHGKGNTGYTPGEKIYVKINVTNSCCSMSGTTKTGNYDRMDSTPELLLALLKQLIEEVGVAQEDIYMGDPFRTFRDEYYTLCHEHYPDVNYTDGLGINGRYKTVPTEDHKMIFSDGKLEYRIPGEYYEADYFINMPCLKSHDTGGITIGAKNHQGSILQDGASPSEQSAYDMHYAFPEHDDSEGGTHRYRHLVDYLGHERMGGNTLLTIVDGIWAGRSWEGFVERWNMEPFNGDYPNSLFISQDLVAIDAVCFDFLLEEYKTKSESQKYPYMAGTDDYLMQAADPENWADGIVYDPEGDGTPIGSLGVYEHWNNATDKNYSGNLGGENGIELVKVMNVSFPHQITMENSQLPSNNVSALVVDEAEVAWFGTDAGLAQFDGINWFVYTTSNGLSSNQINDIEVADDKAVIWIATDLGLQKATINPGAELTDFGTYNEANSELEGDAVSNLMYDSNKVLWVGTDKAVNVVKDETWDSESTAADSYGDLFSFSEFAITDIEEYQHDSMALISTKGKGIIRYGYNEVDGFTGASTYAPPWASLNTENVYAITVNGEEQWYGTDIGAYYHPNNQTKAEWINYNKEFNHLLNDQITDVHIDRAGNVWIGTHEGINIITAEGNFLKHTVEYGGLINDDVTAIEEDSKGNIWISTNGGVEWFDNLPGVDVYTNIEEPLLKQHIDIYPNPAIDFINLKFSVDRPTFARVSIYNLNGQLVDVVFEDKIRDNNYTTTVDISNQSYFKKGIYIVLAEIGEKRQFLKIEKL